MRFSINYVLTRAEKTPYWTASPDVLIHFTRFLIRMHQSKGKYANDLIRIHWKVM